MLGKCKVKMELDAPEARYRLGEVITGTLEATPLADAPWARLSLTIHWETERKGNRATELPHVLTLYEGAWTKGSPQRYPFSFYVPDGPPTYNGVHLDIVWYLTARAEMRRAYDVTVRQKVHISPNPATPQAAPAPEPPHAETPDRHAPANSEAFDAVISEAIQETTGVTVSTGDAQEPRRRRGGSLITLGQVIFYFFGSVMLAMGLMRLIGNLEEGLYMILFGILFIGIPYLVFRQFYTPPRKPYAEAQAKAEPSVVRPGETVRLTVRLPGASVRKPTATIRARERVLEKALDTGGYEVESRTQHHDYTPFKQTRPLQLAHRDTGDVLEAAFQIPPEGPCTFKSAYNSISWSIGFDIDLEGFEYPWRDSVRVVVKPR